jgi:triosephosphate isomerase
MEHPLVFGNWKSHFTVDEALSWLEDYRKLIETERFFQEVKATICAPFTTLYPLNQRIKEQSLALALGGQDLSATDEGAYTGEVSARMLAELVDYVLVGHSERRRLFGESGEVVRRKLEKALEVGLTPILCAASLDQIPAGVKGNSRVIVMFEPPAAISKGGQYRAEAPEEIKEILREWRKGIGSEVKLFYGGSVNPENVTEIFAQSGVDGVVVGHASLDPTTFVEILVRLQGT